MGLIQANTLTFESVSTCLNDESIARQYMEMVSEVTLAEMGSIYVLQRELAKNNFFRFADLISNQPQVYGRVEVRSRDDLVGPDEASIKLTYEKGWVNVNSYREFQESCGSSGDTYQCLDSYLTVDRLATLERGDRVAFNLEYVEKKAYNFRPRADLPVVTADAAHSLVASASYGRYLQFGASGLPQSRLDIGLSYENVSDDETRQDRGLMNITYSQRVSDIFVLAVSAIYANRPEFRGMVDKEVSVNLGLNYKLLPASEF